MSGPAGMSSLIFHNNICIQRQHVVDWESQLNQQNDIEQSDVETSPSVVELVTNAQETKGGLPMKS